MHSGRKLAAEFFFFQAEDGIRDKLVTGVQTCALPISRARSLPHLGPPFGAAFGGSDRARANERVRTHRYDLPLAPRTAATMLGRSEERRVGKECGLRRAGCW